jgi:hypothetical protein
MKTTIGIFLSVLFAAGCDRLPQWELERGGVTFDFQKLSDQRFRIPEVGDPRNIDAVSAWRSGEYCNFHGVKLTDYAAMRKKAISAIEWNSDHGVYSICKKPQMETLLGVEVAKRTSAGFVRTIKLPNSQAGRYRVNFRYKAEHKYQSAMRSSYVLMYFKKRDPKTGKWVEAKDVTTTGGTYYSFILNDTDGNWNVYSKEFELKDGCQAIEMIMRIDGIGNLGFKDFTLIGADGAKEQETLELSPHGELGGDFEISEGQVGLIGFYWAHDNKKAIKKNETVFTLHLPAGFEFIASTFGDNRSVKLSRHPDGSSTARFTMLASYELQWCGYNRMAALVRSAGRVGCAGKAKLSVESKGVELAKPVEFKLRTGEKISALAPERYFNGVFPSGTSVHFGDRKATEELADFFAKCGVRWIIFNNPTKELTEAWRNAGIAHITPELGASNGYFFGNDKNIPAADKFQFSPTSEDWRLGHDKTFLANGYCPMAIIEQRSYVVTNAFVKRIDDRLKFKGVDGGWSNWEPFMYETRGCICEKCKRRFEEWKLKNPKGTLQDFRSKLHAEVVRTIDRHVRKIVGGGVGMIPGVSWREGCSAWRRHYGNGEVKPVDYAGDMEWMNFWGPYIYWDAQAPYGKTEREALWHFLLAKDVREYTDSEYSPDRRPKLMAFPHGLEGRSWVTQPEHLAMGFDAYFFNRWQAAVGYFFPQGYDARYWRGFAEATSRAALCEKFVVEGRRCDSDFVLNTVAEYEKPVTIDSKYTPLIKDASRLQHAAYKYEGSQIVAVLNFSDYVDAFFTLKAKNLSGKFLIVDDKGVIYRPSSWRKAWSGEELASGVMLYTAAARTKVFFIVPESSKLYPKPRAKLTAGAISKLYRMRQKELSDLIKAKTNADAGSEKIVRPKYRFD